MRTLLDICQDFALRVGTDVPTLIVNGQAPEKQQLRLLMETARDLIRRHDWQVLEKVATFTTTAVELQATITTTWPDFRRIKKGTFINITKKRRMLPIDAIRHSTLTLQSATTDLPWYRIRGNQLLIPGNTSSGDSCQFEYMSDRWVISADGTTYRSIPTEDTDVVLLNDEAMILGLKWRWKKEAGLAYGEDFTDYEKLVQELQGSDRENRTLTLGGRQSPGMVLPELGDEQYLADTTILTADMIGYDGSYF